MGKKSPTTVTTQATGPAQTPEEKRLAENSVKIADYSMPNFFKLQDMATNGLVNQFNPDYKNIYDNGNAQIANQQQNFANTQNGIINPAYLANEQKIINDQLQGTVGQAVNRLNQKGILNSDITRDIMGDVSGQVGKQITNNFNQDLATQSQLASQGMDIAADPLRYASTAQSAALQNPKELFALATGQAAPTNDVWQALAKERLSLSSPARTEVMPASGGILGGLLSGYASGMGMGIGKKL